MDYLFYPGCALEASSGHYLASAKATMEALGHGLRELRDWNCCGATAYIGTDETKAIAYSVRNLALAEGMGATDLLTACSGCYVMLRKAQSVFMGAPRVRERVERALERAGLAYRGSVEPRHLAHVLLEDIGPSEIRARLKASLAGLRVAVYHGCQIGRPFGDSAEAERPSVLNRLLEATEAEIVPFPLTAKCCGGMLMTTRREIGLDLVYDLLSCARAFGAQCIAVACPLCLVNLEGYQAAIAKDHAWEEPLPILLFTQLLGLALGAPVDGLGLERSLLDSGPLLARYT